MESQTQNPEFKNNPESFHPCECRNTAFTYLICLPHMECVYMCYTADVLIVSPCPTKSRLKLNNILF